MTVLDTSVEHYPALMVLGGHAQVRANDAHLPEGYRFQPWDRGYRLPWASLHAALGFFPSVEAALATFDATYGDDPAGLARQMVLACTEDGALAGTSSLWEGTHFGEKRLRVHWVGVDPAHQRRGIARALLLRTIALYGELAAEGAVDPAVQPLYLATDTEAWAAVSLYRKLGFQPYLGSKPAGIHRDAATWEQDNRRAWQIIDGKLAEPADAPAGSRVPAG